MPLRCLRLMFESLPLALLISSVSINRSCILDHVFGAEEKNQVWILPSRYSQALGKFVPVHEFLFNVVLPESIKLSETKDDLLEERSFEFLLEREGRVFVGGDFK